MGESTPSIASSHPNSALPAPFGGTSLCMALPDKRTLASSLPNSSSPRRRTGSSASRTRSSTPEVRLRRRIRATGPAAGSGVNSASSSGSLMRDQPSTIRSQAAHYTDLEARRVVALHATM